MISFVLCKRPKNIQQLRVWTLLFPVFVSYYWNTGYASISEEGMRLHNPAQWAACRNQKMVEHLISDLVKKFMKKKKIEYLFPLFRPVLLIVLIFWPFVAPAVSLLSHCAWLPTWMVLLRRPDLTVMTKTMRSMFGREPRVEEVWEPCR